MFFYTIIHLQFLLQVFILDISSLFFFIEIENAVSLHLPVLSSISKDCNLIGQLQRVTVNHVIAIIIIEPRLRFIMASNPIDEFELSCSLCSQLYSSPRVLPCLHSFCRACLENHQKKVCGEGEELTCPINYCQESAGEIALDELPTNVWLEGKISVETNIGRILKGNCNICDESSSAATFCTDCGIALCGGCVTNWHNKNKLYRNHSLVPISESVETTKPALVEHFAQSVQQKGYCSKHGKKEAEFKCQDCNEIRCYLCCLSGCCKNHNYQSIADLAEDTRSNLKDSVQSLTDPSEKLKVLLSECKKTKDQLTAHEKECEETIEAVVSDRIAALMKQKKELLTRCRTIAQSKQTRLDLQIEHIQGMTQQLEHSCTVVSQACSDYTDTELLAVSDEMVQRLEKLDGEFEKEKLYPCTTDAIVSTFNDQQTRLGEIFEGCYSPNCTLEVRNNTITCSVNNETKLRLVTQNEEGDLYTRGGDKVEAQLIGSHGEVPVKILDNDDGTYQLLFTPNSAGEYQLFVKINSSEIMGSPFKVTVSARYYPKNLYLSTIDLPSVHGLSTPVDDADLSQIPQLNSSSSAKTSAYPQWSQLASSSSQALHPASSSSPQALYLASSSSSQALHLTSSSSQALHPASSSSPQAASSSSPQAASSSSPQAASSLSPQGASSSSPQAASSSSPQAAYSSSPQAAYSSSPQAAYSPSPQAAYSSSPQAAYSSSHQVASSSSPQAASSSSPQAASSSSPQAAYNSSPQALHPTYSSSHSLPLPKDLPQSTSKASAHPSRKSSSSSQSVYTATAVPTRGQLVQGARVSRKPPSFIFHTLPQLGDVSNGCYPPLCVLEVVPAGKPVTFTAGSEKKLPASHYE